MDKNLGKVHALPSNYYSIDNIFLKLSIITMSLSNYQNIVNIPFNNKTTLSKIKGKYIRILGSMRQNFYLLKFFFFRKFTHGSIEISIKFLLSKFFNSR
jgi:hypothetical protein